MYDLTYHNLGISKASIAEHPEQNVIRVTENFRKIQDLLAEAAIEAGREPATVRLLAASITQTPETLLEAVSGGQRDVGENFAARSVIEVAVTVQHIPDRHVEARRQFYL